MLGPISPKNSNGLYTLFAIKDGAPYMFYMQKAHFHFWVFVPKFFSNALATETTIANLNLPWARKAGLNPSAFMAINIEIDPTELTRMQCHTRQMKELYAA